MKRPATPDQTVPSCRPRLDDPEDPEDVPVVYPAGEQRGGSTDAPPGRQPDTVAATSFAGSGSEEEEAGPSQVVPGGDVESEEWETSPEGDSDSYQSAVEDPVPGVGSSPDLPPVTLTAEEMAAVLESAESDSSSEEEFNQFHPSE